MQDQKTWLMLSKRLSGSETTKESEAFLVWINENEKNKELFNKTKRIWEGVETNQDLSHPLTIRERFYRGTPISSSHHLSPSPKTNKKAPTLLKGLSLLKLASTYSPIRLRRKVPSAQAGLTTLFGMGRGSIMAIQFKRFIVRV